MTEVADASPRFDPRSVAVACVAGLVALALGLVNVGRSFGYDEAITYAYFVNGGSLERALTTQLVFNNHQLFSALLAVAWKLGLVGETGQRLLPIACGSTAVALVTWHSARRGGPIAGLTAGAVLALNPVFLMQSRSLRGYSLAALAVLLAAFALHRSWADHRHRWLAAQGACMVVAVATHSYSALTILALATGTAAMGRMRRAHVATWLAAATVTILVQLPLLDDALDNARARGNRFRSDFPIDLARWLLGRSVAAAVLTGALVAAGLYATARRSRRHGLAIAAGAGTITVSVAFVWLVAQPFDLYPRFFISVIPIGALLAGRGAALLPRPAAAGVGVLVIALLVPGVRNVLDDEPTIRDAALIVDAARSRGLDVCGRFTEPLEVYTAPVTPRDHLDLADCDVYVVVGRSDQARRESIAARYTGSGPIGGGITVYADDQLVGELLAARE